MKLNKLYDNLHLQVIGGFVNSTYWSSTEHDNVNAASQRFDNGNQPTNSKSHSFHVRAVRTFIQKTYVPDDNFEAYLETHDASGNVVVVGASNSMGDGIANNDSVTTANISGVTNLAIQNQNIANIIGLQDFSNLTHLYCGGNQLSILDVSQNTSLTNLGCWQNQLTSLDLSFNPNLSALEVFSNLLS